MEIQVEELTQVLKVHPKTLSPPSPFPFSSLPFFQCQTSRPWERACAGRICASWVVRKARESKQASPSSALAHRAPGGRPSRLPASLYSQQPALGKRGAEDLLETHPVSFPLSLGTHQGVPSSSCLTVLKLPFMSALNFYLIKEQMLSNWRPVGD